MSRRRARRAGAQGASGCCHLKRYGYSSEAQASRVARRCQRDGFACVEGGPAMPQLLGVAGGPGLMQRWAMHACAAVDVLSRAAKD